MSDAQYTLRQLFPMITDTADPVWDCGAFGVSAVDDALCITVEAAMTEAQLEKARLSICRAYGISGVQFQRRTEDVPAPQTPAQPEEGEEAYPSCVALPEDAAEWAEEALPEEWSESSEPELPPEAAEKAPEPDSLVPDTGLACPLEPEAAQLTAQLRDAFSQKHPSVAPCLKEATLLLHGSVLELHVKEAWHMTRIEHLQQELEQEAGELASRPIKLQLFAPEKADAAAAFERKRAADLQRMKQEQPVSFAQPAPAQQGEQRGQRRNFAAKRDPNAPMFRPKEDDSVIYGKPFAKEMTKLKDLNLDSGKVSVEGEIFMTEFKKLNGRGKTVVMFEFSDGTGSLRASKVLPDDEAKELSDGLRQGLYVIVQGLVHYSQFDKDIVMNPHAIVQGKKRVRQDRAAEKRVELHLHTCMSSMDGLCDPQKALKLAASMGHRAMAITDHGVVQAFPDAMKGEQACKKAGKEIKVLYGIEAYCVDDLNRGNSVKGDTDAGLRDEIVVFDTETTGLSAQNCEIIEIAAYLVAGGEIRDSFQCYVKPEKPIPEKITQLTGIHNQTVQNARSIREELPRFLEFCGQRPVCAHNADFDMAFIRAACDRLGLQAPVCSIDTVELSRALLPNLQKHKLNYIASAMELSFQHHRASDDAQVLAKIFLRFISMLEERCGIQTVREINGALARLRSGSGPDKSQKSYHLLILVKNRPGLIALYQLISDAHLKYFNRRPIIPMSQLSAHRENLICGSACVAGELFSAIVDGRPWGELMQLASFFDFLEIQPLANNHFLLDKELAQNEEQLRDFNRTVLKLGDALHKPVCATGDVHFLEPEDSIYREILQAGMGFKDAEDPAPLYFKTTDEMLEEFSYLGAERAYEVVVKNTNAIADQCEAIEPVLSGSYPPSIENSAQDLERMVRSKAKELYEVDGALPPIVKDRMEAELIPIIEHGFDVMYMIAQKLVAKSNEAGYLVGSRGSVGSSFVAFLSGITEVNGLQPHYRCPQCNHTIWDVDSVFQTGIDMPDRDCPKCGHPMKKDGYNIPFATFLGFNADKTPDIDLNFSGEYQLQAHRNTVEIFGKDKVFKAGTIGTIKDKTAFGFVKKYLDEKERVVNNAEIDHLVSGCTGIKRTTGQHPGGLIVVPNDRSIYEFTPIQHPADDPNSDIITTHFDFHSIHDNLLKLDELGHDVPTIIRHLQNLSGIGPQDIPLDDKDTMRIFTDIAPLKIESDDILEQPGSAGIPEFGTKNARSMLMETQPTTFDGLVRISGLSHGTNVWRNNAQDIINQGYATLKDVISVRDDITTHLIAMGLDNKTAFTISESVRKGKGLKPEWEETMKSHGLPDWYIGSCKKIEYMFPRAHAVAYTMMSYRIAWFKVHRPLEYYCVYFSNRLDSFDCGVALQGDGVICRKYRELRAMPKRTAVEDDNMITLEICHEFCKRGFEFLPMDLYHSDVKDFKIEGNGLRPPFMALSGLGEAAAQSIAEERKKEPFMSGEDVVLRCDKVSTAVMQTLRDAGALGDLPESNQLDLFSALG